jgi:hypothetical protein
MMAVTECRRRANKRVQRTHSRVTPLAEERKRRATRRAADAQRWADEKHREGERLERGAASLWVARVADALVSGACPSTLAPGRSTPSPVAMQHSGPVACGTVRSAGACTKQLATAHSALWAAWAGEATGGREGGGWVRRCQSN